MIIHSFISVGNLKRGMTILKSYLNEYIQSNYLKLKTNKIIPIKQYLIKKGYIILHILIQS